MKRFLIKFCILLGIIYGFMGYFALIIRPSLSGDMGYVGKIPFGREYDDRITRDYLDSTLKVHSISEEDTISSFIITIGDSFSQFEKLGYSQFVAEELDCEIDNVLKQPYTPEQTFIRLVNNNKIPAGSVVIIESVERSMIDRLIGIDFQDSILINKLSLDAENLSLLDETLIWLRATFGFKQPIVKFHTSKDLFSHLDRHYELYIYNSKWVDSGDLLFPIKLKEEHINDAYQNLYKMHDVAVNNGINMIYLIAADKYDVYEPFIIEEHLKNPTLDKCPEEQWIVNTKTILQAKVCANVKDLYMINDTHWSPIGSELIATELVLRIRYQMDE